MTVTRPAFASPLILIDDFLSPEGAAEVLRECIELRPVYAPAQVGNGAATKSDTKNRRNEVVYLNDVYRTAPGRSKILSLIGAKMREEESRSLWHEGDLIFDIINYATWHESVLSRYGNCDFYGSHQDTVRDAQTPANITHRLVTLVYYVNAEPERFTGGQLTLLKNGQSITFEPKHNRAIVFPSFTFHNVSPVRLESEEFADGRFSLNHWMGFR